MLYHLTKLSLLPVLMGALLNGCKNNGYYKNNNHGTIEINLYQNSATSLSATPAFLVTDHVPAHHCVGENNYNGGTSSITSNFEIAGYCIKAVSDLTTQGLTNSQTYFHVLVDCTSGSLTSYDDSATTSLLGTSLFVYSEGASPAFNADDTLKVTVTCYVQGQKRAYKKFEYTEPVASTGC